MRRHLFVTVFLAIAVVTVSCLSALLLWAHRADAREALGFPFDSGQTWRVQRGYNCTPCNTHRPLGEPGSSGADSMGLDLQRTNCNNCNSGGENVRAAFSGTVVASGPFLGDSASNGCFLTLRGNDNRDFLYVHLATNNGTCNPITSSPNKGDIIAHVGTLNHVHVQWCDRFFSTATCPRDQQAPDPAPLNEGVFPFYAGGPFTSGCGEWCGATLTSSAPPPDRDRDGIPDSSDACPDLPEDAEGFQDGDGCPEGGDVDSDGVAGYVDNCPDTPNADQLNTDGDAQGDACDPDDDNDGMPDVYELAHPCLNPLVDDANLDPDGDAYTNLVEYLAYYDPCVPNPKEFHVDETSDEPDSTPRDLVCLTASGHCSLRAAIDEANADAGADVIVVPAAYYRLSRSGAGEGANGTGDLDITDSVTIAGAGSTSTTIDAQLGDRAIQIQGGTTVHVSGVTVTGGKVTGGQVGGGIDNAGTLDLSDVVVMGNSADWAGGINNWNTLSLLRSTVTLNAALNAGGGIGTSGTSLSLTDSTVSQNNAGWGGGISSWGEAVVDRSTVNNNFAVNNGGGIDVGSGNPGTLTLMNSTVAQNTADFGGGIANFGTTVLYYTTVDSNRAAVSGGNLYASGSTTLRGTIVSESLGGGNCSAPVNSIGYNLDSDGTCALGYASDIVGQPSLLGPLQNNGGYGATEAPLAQSPAIDTASGCPATDQTGISRPIGAGCDMGAFEARVANAAASVGGISEPPDVRALPSLASASGDSSAGLVAGGAGLAAVAALGAGWWLWRRRASA